MRPVDQPKRTLLRKPSTTGKTIREILFTALLVLFVFFLVAVRKADHAAATQPSRIAIAPAEARAAQRAEPDWNHGLPAMIDSETLMTRIEAGAAVDTYYITTINFPSHRLGREFFARAQAIIGSRNCQDNDIRSAYAQGKAAKYVVSGSDNVAAGFFVITSAYCDRFRAPPNSPD